MFLEEEKKRITLMTGSRQRGESQPNRYELKLVKKNGRVMEVESSVSIIDLDGAPVVMSTPTGYVESLIIS